MRRYAKVLFAIASLASLFAFAGSAGAAFVHKGTFAGGPSASPGEFDTPARAAVEPGTGNLFVVDSANGRVQVFKPNAGGTADYLTDFGAGTLSAPWGIAIDVQGGQTSVYVADAGNDRILKYASDEAAVPTFTNDGAFSSPAKGSASGQVGDFKAALAIDSETHQLLVADRANKLIQRFAASGTFISAFDGSNGGPTLEGPIDLATNSDGDIYVVDANGDIANGEGTSKVLRYSASGAYHATLGEVGTHERPATVAVNPFDDSVVVSGDQDNVYEAGPPPYQPVLGVFDSANQPLGTPTLNGSAQYDTVAGMAVGTDVKADHLYVVLDQGRYFGSPYGTVQVQAFANPHPQAPTVSGQSASPTQREATLRAIVNPGSLETKYRFEYGLTSSYGQTTASRVLAAGPDDVEARLGVTGLSPATTYHFRVVVENSLGEEAGPDATFTTAAPAGAGETCPNEATRTGLSAQLSECRAYEMVSPVAKNGTDVFGLRGLGTRAAANGERAMFSSIGGFAGTESLMAMASYLSERTPNGWVTRGITPAIDTTAGVASPNGVQGVSPNLDRFVLLNFNPPLTADATPDTSNLYLWGPGERYSLLTPTGPTDAQERLTYKPVFVAASEDFRTIIFESAYPQTTDSVAGVTNLYEWSPEGVRLVGILPNGSPAPGGSVAGTLPLGTVPGTSTAYTSTAISPDGRAIFWTSVADRQLYARIDGTETKWVSRTQRTNDSGPGGADPQGTQQPLFMQSSPDGAVAFFISTEKLTNDSTADAANGAADLYAFDVDSGNLIDLSVAPDSSAPAKVLGVLGTSGDGSSVYFAAMGDLTGDGPEVGPEKVNLYLWRNGAVRYVTTVENQSNSETINWEAAKNEGGGEKSSRVTADGDVLVFSSTAELSDYPTNGTRQIYRYSASEDEVECVSCNPRAEQSSSAASSFPEIATGTTMASFFPRIVSSNGKRIYFNTSEALVARDTNNLTDVYMWSNGTLDLISSGQGLDSYLAEASPSGDDVFFVTRNRLVSTDIDHNADLYDARVGGGFTASSVGSECAGEDCQPAAREAPVARKAGSALTFGPTKRQRARCPKSPRGGHKGTRRTGRGGKHCGAKKQPKKSKKAKRQRAAGAKRGDK